METEKRFDEEQIEIARENKVDKIFQKKYLNQKFLKFYFCFWLEASLRVLCKLKNFAYWKQKKYLK